MQSAENIQPIVLPQCPFCKAKENVRKLQYGRVREWPEWKNQYYYLAGCFRTSMTHICLKCDKEFKK